MRYYFLGIAGTAMASLAVLLKQKGHEVWGTDQGIYPPMSDYLRDNQINVWQGYDIEHLQQPFDRVVIGNAMSRGNVEVEEILNRQLPFVSMPELIRDELVFSHKTIVITGTHGKTTTTALMSWVLDVAGLSPGFLIGGISRNFDASVRIGSGDYFVIEGDEYDSAFFDKRPKFLHYFPHYLIINNLEFDHADIYPDLDTIKREFRKLVRIMPSKGLLAANALSETVRSVVDPVYSRLSLYGPGSDNAIGYQLLSTGKDGLHFSLFESGKSVGQFLFPFPGEYQLHNVAAVVAIARDIGLTFEQIREGLATFKGVKRRMEYWGTYKGADVYDDFAHHPTAIAVTLQAMRHKFPDRRLVALFEPRTNTTVRNFFQDELGDALAIADVSIVTPIHRAERIPAGERLSLDKLASDLHQQNRQILLPGGFDELPQLLPDILQENDVLILLTNGGLGGFYKTLRDEVQTDSAKTSDSGR